MEAIQNGAKKIISEKDLDINIPYKKVKDTHAYLQKNIPRIYAKYLKNLKIIGVTGTNGKTTSAYLMYQMLKKLKKKCAYLGTIGYYIDNERYPVQNTTPDIVELYKILLDIVNKNMEYLVMEVSSTFIRSWFY